MIPLAYDASMIRALKHVGFVPKAVDARRQRPDGPVPNKPESAALIHVKD